MCVEQRNKDHELVQHHDKDPVIYLWYDIWGDKKESRFLRKKQG